MSEGIVRALEPLGLEEHHNRNCNYVVTHVGVLLQYIQRGIPSFTDHGPQHSARVLGYLAQIADQYPVLLSSEDKMILAMGAVLHDIGCIAGRENHNEKSVEILGTRHFSSIRNRLTQESYRFLQEIIRAHSSSYDLLVLKNDGKRDSRLPFLCCLLRLADSCDISSDRIPRFVLEVLESLDILDSMSLNVWKSHLEVEKVYFEGTAIVVQVYDTNLAESWIDKIEAEVKLIKEVLESYSLPVFGVKIKLVPRAT